MKRLIVIAAIGKNNELGNNNDLIWHIKEDLRFFRENTTGHHVVMGKNTFLSLPKMLPNRTHMVLNDDDYEFPKGVIVLRSLDEFFEKAREIDDDIYVIGGAFVYSQFAPLADELILTEIDDECPSADVYFPTINHDLYDKTIIEEHLDEKPAYKFVSYKKRKINK